MRKLWVALMLLLCCSTSWADDVKREMIGVMDTICKGGAAAEALIDWDHLNIVAPSLAGRDLQAVYRSMNQAQRAAFRRGLVSTFSRSFQARARGASYATVAQKPGKFSFNTKGKYPSLTAQGRASNLTVQFNRVGGKLKIARMHLV